MKKDGKVTHAIDFGMLKQELSDIVVEHQNQVYTYTDDTTNKTFIYKPEQMFM